MKIDKVLQQEIPNIVQWQPLPVLTNVIANANSGVVDYYTTKMEFENCTFKVVAIKSVINTIAMEINSWDEQKDIDITSQILLLFKWNWNTLNNTIKVLVVNGWVTLSGAVAWNYQKEAAKQVVTDMIGVKGVTNNIVIIAQTPFEIDKAILRAALENHLELYATPIAIIISGATITLKGTVDSWYQKEIAGRIAWKAPGVQQVKNELVMATEA
jgi:osmotically-inducible protein OsmY